MRIFSVRINLDDMFARLDGLDAQEELSWHRGFRLGSRGKALPEGASAALEDGWDFGRQAYTAAVSFSNCQSAKAKLRHSRGSAAAQPKHMPETMPNPAISSNPIIQLTKERENHSALPDFFHGMDQDETPIEIAKPIPLEINWRDWRSHHPLVYVARAGEDGSATDWELIFHRYTLRCFDAMYERLVRDSPGKRIYYSAALMWLQANTKVKQEAL